MKRWLETLTDPVLLRRAEAKAKGYGEEQRARIVTLHRAAKARANAAAELRSEGESPAALALLREAFALSSSMVLVSRGEQEPDAPVLSVETAWQTMAETHPEHAALAELLGNPDLLAPDALDAAEVERLRPLLESLTNELLKEVERRSPRAIKVQRVVRIVAVGIAVLVLLVASVAWAARPTNLARGKNVSTSSRFPGSPDPAGVVDGNRSAAFGAHTNIQDDPWIEVDLGKARALGKVVVYHRSDGYESESLPLTLELSEDHSVWTKIATRSELFTAAKPWIQPLAGQHARWIRLRLERHGYIALGEIEVYEK